MSAGLVNRVFNVSKPEHPLPEFDKLNAFKLYLFDTGLLKCMAGVDNREIILKSNFQFKGALTENYVCQQLKTLEIDRLYYYTNDRGSSEVEFIIDVENMVIPIEVKAKENLKSKSLKSGREKYTPKKAVRTSLSDYRDGGGG